MKKIICLALSLIMTLGLLSPIKTHADDELYYELPLDYVHEIEAGSDDLVQQYSFTAEKDGIYSVTSKPINGYSYLSQISGDIYTDDFRSNGNVQTYYYKLQKGQEVKLSFRVKANSSAQIFRQTVDLIKGGDEFEFTGEFDKSFIVDANGDELKTLGYFKFACDIPKDKDGNNIFIERARMFYSNPTDTTIDYLTREDKSFNEAISLSQTGQSKEYFIFNIYSYKRNDTSVNIDNIKSKIQFIQLEDFNTDTVKFNLADNPEAIVENTNCYSEKDESGNTYNKYYYREQDYLKSVSLEFSGGVKKEILASEKPETEKDPFSRYTGIYPRFTDTQKSNHWKKGTNYFTAKFGYYNKEEIPVNIISMSDEQVLKLFDEKAITYYAQSQIVKTFGIDVDESGEYVISIIADNSNDGSNAISCDVNNVSLGYFTGYIPLNNNMREYSKSISLNKGKNVLRLGFLHTGEKSGQIKLCIKKLVGISSITLNSKSNAPKIVENTDKSNGKYAYDISDYVKSLDVNFNDGKQSTFYYNTALKSFVSDDEKKYSSYNVSITDSQTTNSWAVGTNYVYISIGENEVNIPIEIIKQDTLDEFEADKTYTLQFNSDGKSKQAFKFTPSKSGYYSFTSQAKLHDDNKCAVKYETSIANYYDNVDDNAPFRLIADMTYTVILEAKHSDNCKYSDISAINFQTKLTYRQNYAEELMIDETKSENLESDGTFSNLYIFKPAQTGKYRFNITAATHNDNCKTDTYCNIYLNGKKVGNDLKANNTYIIEVNAKHNNSVCSINNCSSIKLNIKPIKEYENTETEQTTTTTTTTTTTKETTSTTKPSNPTSSAASTSHTTSNEQTSTAPIQKTDNESSHNLTSQIQSDSDTQKPAAENVTKPKTTKLKKLVKSKKSVTVYWAKTQGVKGYQIQIATDKEFKKNKKEVNIKKQQILKTTIKKLKSNKKYYIRVRTYKVYKGKNIYSNWSNIKSVKTK